MATTALGSIKLLIMNPEQKVFEGTVTSIFIQGDTGEYELLPYHYPVLGLLCQGRIIIDWKYAIYVKKGIARFFKNDCVILVELDQEKT
ncbi:MAG: hypothetical protein ABH885_02505 [Candidatus Omnitrophota bacterium]